MLNIDKENNKNTYIVGYSKLQKKFSLVNVATGHVVKCCDLFRGIYEKIKVLREKEDILIHFSDNAIDELQLRGFERAELPEVVGGVK